LAHRRVGLLKKRSKLILRLPFEKREGVFLWFPFKRFVFPTFIPLFNSGKAERVTFVRCLIQKSIKVTKRSLCRAIAQTSHLLCLMLRLARRFKP
jgi:hypothetical protein